MLETLITPQEICIRTDCSLNDFYKIQKKYYPAKKLDNFAYRISTKTYRTLCKLIKSEKKEKNSLVFLMVFEGSKLVSVDYVYQDEVNGIVLTLRDKLDPKWTVKINNNLIEQSLLYQEFNVKDGDSKYFKKTNYKNLSPRSKLND